MVELSTTYARSSGTEPIGVTGGSSALAEAPIHKSHNTKLISYEQFKKEAPISSVMEEILRNVENSPISIVQATTGAGKSLLIPLALEEAGFSVVSTQPRILAAKSLAEFSSRLTGNTLGDLIGYETAMDKNCGPQTRIRYCTDGLTKVRELCKRGGDRNVLIIDEVHEFNANIEVLLAWVKRELKYDPNLKVVLMSATMEADALSKFFNNAPITKVESPRHPLRELEKGHSIEADTVRLIKEGYSPLVFLPGKREIADLQEYLRLANVDADIFPLHGELTPEEQARAFEKSDRPKCIIATDIAQTSLTIPGINAVIVSGTKKQIQVQDGIEMLCEVPISQADFVQQIARACREGEGVFISHHPQPENERRPFGVAEIDRKRLDIEVLQLARIGLDMEDLEFFHQPKKEEIQRAKRSLITLGCMTEDLKLTPIGEKVIRLPVSAKVGRMIIEAKKRDVLDDVITIAAIIEGKGLISRDALKSPFHSWKSHFKIDEQESDLLAQLKVFNAVSSMSKEEAIKHGVHWQGYRKTKEVRRHLLKSLGLWNGKVSSTGDREDIMKSVVSGMLEDIYQCDGLYCTNGKQTQEKSFGSVVRYADLVAGVAFDVQYKRRFGMATKKLLHLLTKVNTSWLPEIAPHLTEVKKSVHPRYDLDDDSIVSYDETTFNGKLLGQFEKEDPNHPEKTKVFASWLAHQMYSGSFLSRVNPALGDVVSKNSRILERIAAVNQYSSGTISSSLMEDLGSFLETRLGNISTLRELTDPNILLFEEEYLNRYPDTIEISGKPYSIEYQSRIGPVINIPITTSTDQTWKSINDDTLKLPTGLKIGVRFILPPRTTIEAMTISEARVRLLPAIDDLKLYEWITTQPKREFNVNDPNKLNIEEHVIGVKELDGTPLNVYGAYSVISHYPAHIAWSWLDSRTQAEAAVSGVEQSLAAMREELIRAEARVAAQRAQQEEFQARERELQRQISAGEALSNYLGTLGGRNPEGYELFDLWVITPEGALRNANTGYWLKTGASQGQRIWDYVQKDELAISVRCKDRSALAKTLKASIDHMPPSGISGITKEQLKAIEEIETKLLRVPKGSLGLNEEGLKKRSFLEALQNALPTCPVTGKSLEWKPEQIKELKSNGGYLLVEKDPKIYPLINYSDSFIEWPGGGKAQLVYMEEIDGGTLEVFAVDQSFGAKVVVRWNKKK